MVNVLFHLDHIVSCLSGEDHKAKVFDPRRGIYEASAAASLSSHLRTLFSYMQ